MGDLVNRVAAWLYWRVPRLWMNRTAWAFWAMREKQRLTLRKRAKASPQPESPTP